MPRTGAMADWVLAVERAYVAAVNASAPPLVDADPELRMRARAAAGAVASRYLAVGTPRTLAVIGDDPEAARASVEAHRTWFQPRELRATDEAVAAALEARQVSLPEALTADIVCVLAPVELVASQLRRGTHVNALAPLAIDPDLARLALTFDELDGLPQLAAGMIDGRQLDEITIFLAGDAPIAAAALAGAR